MKRLIKGKEGAFINCMSFQILVYIDSCEECCSWLIINANSVEFTKLISVHFSNCSALYVVLESFLTIIISTNIPSLILYDYNYDHILYLHHLAGCLYHSLATVSVHNMINTLHTFKLIVIHLQIRNIIVAVVVVTFTRLGVIDH